MMMRSFGFVCLNRTFCKSLEMNGSDTVIEDLFGFIRSTFICIRTVISCRELNNSC